MNAIELSDNELDLVTGGDKNDDALALVIPHWKLIKEVANSQKPKPKRKEPASIDIIFSPAPILD